ncbi:phage holin family protein [Stakelama sp. CBK3Z-3]|uniref:Phage holin family protein n=1 Tax=Stakelama flava TaxID=2860338 RepID=A0ABS6XHF3_9SPHN|nr:phage holin family protein [Stakelama flava]
MKGHRREAAGLISLARQLIRDARTWVSAEIDFYRALAAERMADAKLAAGFAVGAIILANAALIALLIGAILVLWPYVGAFWATIIIVALTLMVAAWLALSALSHAKRAMRNTNGGGR